MQLPSTGFPEVRSQSQRQFVPGTVLTSLLVAWVAGPWVTLRAADAPLAPRYEISVVDAQTNQSIREFQVLAGVPGSDVSREFEARTNHRVANWQPHTLRVGRDGLAEWPLERAYDEMCLRVEAEGYQPLVWRWIKKADGPRKLVFHLKRDPGMAGQVLQPDGKPAGGATVAFGLAQKKIRVLTNGKLLGQEAPIPKDPRDRWRVPTFVKADHEGRFQLHTETVPAVILVVHDAGVRELAYHEYLKSPTIKLQPWGRVEGRVLWKDKPGANAQIVGTNNREQYGYPDMLSLSYKATTDAEGRFVFDRMLPGKVQFSLALSGKGGSKAFLPSLTTFAEIQPGRSAVLLGGQGRKVTGKLTGLKSYEGVTISINPPAPHIGFPGDDSMWKAYSEFSKSVAGPFFFRHQQPVQADGSFILEDIMPGDYFLAASAYVPGKRFPSHSASRHFTIGPETADENPRSAELGEIPLETRQVRK